MGVVLRITLSFRFKTYFVMKFFPKKKYPIASHSIPPHNNHPPIVPPTHTTTTKTFSGWGLYCGGVGTIFYFCHLGVDIGGWGWRYYEFPCIS